MIPDMKIWEKSRIPWSYYMTWSKEFCMTEEYNKKEVMLDMYTQRRCVISQAFGRDAQAPWQSSGRSNLLAQRVATQRQEVQICG